MRTTLSLLIALTAWLANPAQAQSLRTDNAWVRATVPGQTATGGFLTLTASEQATLIKVSTTAAGKAELHEMKMDGEVMTMRALPDGLELPANTPINLRPGGIHLMLLGLKQPLVADSSITVNLTLQSAKGKRWTSQIQVPIRTQAPTPATQP